MHKTRQNYQKFTAGALAVLAALGLLIRVIIASGQFGSVWSGVSHLYQFFTITTNSLVLVVMILLFREREVHRNVILATAASIAGVGIIFHTLLGAPAGQQGWDLLANLITHTFVPIAMVLWWLVYTDYSQVRWTDTWYCLPWPGAYCAYALLRAEYSGFYPYHFIDLEQLGWVGLGKSVFGLSLAFLFLGLLLVSYAKMHHRITRKALPAT
ncbi:MAG: Pr6Pr family membrane protein [Pseudomonadota bacterium]